MAVQVTIIGNRDLSGRFVKVTSDIRKGLRRATYQTAFDVVRRWEGLTRSRRIARGLRVRRRGDARAEVYVTSAIGFPPEVEEFDTRPHLIVPRRAKVLRFVASDGAVVFTRRVRHPGTRGSHAGRRSLEQAAPGHRRRIARVLQEGR
jgi:hypothetical protein